MTNQESTSEQKELLRGFVDEGLEMLDEVEPYLIELEKSSETDDGLDPEVLNTIFRLFHSLKGGASFLDLVSIQAVTHQAETLLEQFRKGKASISSHHIDLLTSTCDFLRQVLGYVFQKFNDSGFEMETRQLVDTLIQSISETSSAQPPRISSSKSENDPAGASTTSDSERSKPLDKQSIINKELLKQFKSESLEQIETAEQALLSLEKVPSSSDDVSIAFRSLHSFKGNAGFMGYGDLEKLSHEVETILDDIRSGEVQTSNTVFSLLLEMMDILRDSISSIDTDTAPRLPGLPGLIHLLRDAVLHEKPATVTEKKTPASHQKTETDAPVEEKSAIETSPIKENEDSHDQTQAISSQRQSIRVDTTKLDQLLDLIGELVIIEAMVAQNQDIRALDVPTESFDKAVRQLDKITRDLQDIATSVRMIPLSGLFKRMIRLVRDLSQKEGKTVNLSLIGEDIEVDKTVIEHITDPLIHIVRNSIDHGLYTAEEIKILGKTETGLLTLEANYNGGEVWLSVTDNGRGLSRNRILGKAAEKGLITGDGSDLKDDEVWDLIFQPGFSTADKVTDVSGRGVGMDVVKKNVEKIRGKIDVQSRVGAGTKIILKIPLTLSIIDGMIVRVGFTRYTIPIVDILKTVQVTREMVTVTPDGQEIINLRGELLPIVKLSCQFGVKADSDELVDGLIVVVENSERRLCLLVDELLGQQQVVIKGLPDYVRGIQGLSGCTILGDGSISLIIDVSGVMDQIET